MKTQTHIIKKENDVFQLICSWKNTRNKRHQNKKFIVEWVKAINVAIENKRTIDSLIYTNWSKLSLRAQNLLNSWIALNHIELSDELMQKFSDKEETSELIAVVEMKDFSLSDIIIHQKLFVVVLDRISNPGNLWTILRSCSSFWVDAIIMTGHSTDLYDPKVIQSSIGGIFASKVIRLESSIQVESWITEISKKVGSCQLIWSTVRTEHLISDLVCTWPTVLLVWNETDWLSKHYKEIATNMVKIPISWPVSSLNVGCATSIFLYEISQQLSKL